jgi:hypothetical protein
MPKLLGLISEMSGKFRTVPRSEYLTQIANWIADNIEPSDVRIILNHAVENLDAFPSIAQLSEISGKVAHKRQNWKYFTVEDCMRCGGVGYHWVTQQHPGELKKTGIVACDDCRAGKNMQIAPKPHIIHTMRQCSNVEYLGPGNMDFSDMAQCNQN